jgi:tetratricopeptide (TPR) repeat protein
LLDQDMAGSLADQALECILSVCPGARIIVVTQEVDQYAAVQWVERGACGILTRPATVPAVMDKLALAVGPQGRIGKLIDKGKKLLEAEQWGEALMAGDEVLAQKPDSAAAYMIRGDAFMGLGMPEKAEPMFLRAAENEELYLAPLKRLAALYEQAGDTDKHLECLHRLHEISPLDTERMLCIGRMEIARGGEAVAGEMFEGVLELARKEAAHRAASLSGKIADMCAGLSPDMAVHYSKKVLELRGSALSAQDIAAVNVLGIELRKQGKWREAVAEYQRVLELVPDHAGLIYNMALACSDGGQTAEAHAWMQRALELEPTLPASGKNVAYNIGVIF